MAIFKRDKRKTRHKTNNSAWMTLDGGFAKRACTVLDISATGARIRVTDQSAMNGRMSISFFNDVHKATRCRMVWRKGSEMGVEFLGAA